MSADENWARWSFASLSSYFESQRGDLKFFTEGTRRNTRNDEEYLEFRMDGPTLREVSKGCWKLRIEINILVIALITEDVHRIHKNVGKVQSSFKQAISVFKYGTSLVDDGSFVGCYQLLQNRSSRDFIELNHFGQIDKDIPLLQATVEGHYEMTLDQT